MMRFDHRFFHPYFMHARYYSPNLGRFLSVDPVGGSVGSSQSWNRYSYVMNSPLNLVDPDGQRTIVSTTDRDGVTQINIYTEIEFSVDGDPSDYWDAASAVVSDIVEGWSGSYTDSEGGQYEVTVDINWNVTEGGGQHPLADQIQLVDSASGQASQIFEGSVAAYGAPAFRSTASIEGGSSSGRINLFERSNTGVGTDYPGVAVHEYGHLLGMAYHYRRNGGMDPSSRDVMFNTLKGPSHYRPQRDQVLWLLEVARRQSGG